MRKFLLCLCVMWSAPAIAVTTNWYVDDEIYQTTTCESGANVTPPNAPAKHGYTFVGWYDADVTVGSWFRIGTPSPDNPLYPTFYQDGDLILRAVGSGANMVADTYNTTTGQITRRVGVQVLTGGEYLRVADSSYIKRDAGDAYTLINNFLTSARLLSQCSHFVSAGDTPIWSSTRHPNTFSFNGQQLHINIANSYLGITDYTQETTESLKNKIQNYLAAQYAAGTPVTVYYPLATPSVETYTPSSP